MTDLIFIEKQLTDHEADYISLCAATVEYINSLRILTVRYIDACHGTAVKSDEEVFRSLCYKYIEKLYELSRTDLPGKLTGAISSLIQVSADATLVSTGNQLTGFQKRADSLLKKILRLSEKINSLGEAVPGYLSRLSSAVDNTLVNEYTNVIPLGFLAVLDMLKSSI